MRERTHYDGCWRDHLECAVAEVEKARATIKRLNRRCQEAEKALNETAKRLQGKTPGNSKLGRALLAFALTKSEERIAELEARLAEALRKGV